MGTHGLQFRIALGLLLAGVAASGTAVFFAWRSMSGAEQQLQLRQREWLALQRVSPAPTPAVVAAITGDVQQAEAALKALRETLRGGDSGAHLRAAKVPAERTDSYFDLAAYVERMRSAAARHHVAVPADERFGFAGYANGGPANGRIAVVFRQRQVLQHLLDELFAASPQRLDKVERDLPGDGKSQGTTEPDLFVMDRTWSVQVPHFIDTLAFRITFTGETAVLRRWLDRLARFDVPVVVRMVEAMPLKGAQTVGRVATRPLVLTGAEEPVPPLVARVPTRFTVTLEYLELLDQPKEATP